MDTSTYEILKECCQKIIWFLYLPSGAMPPSWMLSLSSGITFLISIWFTFPRPLQCGLVGFRVPQGNR